MWHVRVRERKEGIMIWLYVPLTRSFVAARLVDGRIVTWPFR